MASVDPTTAYFNAETTGFYQNIDNRINEAIQTFVFDVFARLVIDYRTVIINLAILSILFYSFQLYKGDIASKYVDVVQRVLVIVFVFGFLFKMDDGIKMIYDTFMVWPASIIDSIVSSMNSVTATTGSENAIIGTIDFFLEQTTKLGLEIFKLGAYDNWMPYIIGLAIIVLGFLLGLVPFGFSAIANITTGVLLSLTPIFLVFLFFKKSSGFFESWIRALMTAVFLKILAYSAMVLTIFMIKHPLADTIRTTMSNKDFAFGNFVAFILTVLLMFMFYKNITGVAASLGSGFTLQASNYEKPVKEYLQGISNRYQNMNKDK